MKRVLLIAVALLALSTPSFSAVTTSDGLITLDFYEDTQLGVDNLWVLDFTVNDIDGLGGVETLGFYFIFYNQAMNLNNQYNNDTEYYEFGYYVSNSLILWPRVMTGDLATPTGESFDFYATPTEEGQPVLGDFWVKMHYSDNLGNEYMKVLQLTGPVDFAPVPEPVSISLFLFGAFILKFLTKKVF